MNEATRVTESQDRHDHSARSAHHDSSSFWALTLGSVGVVYGDIGTSPLYAFREALRSAVGDGPITQTAVLGVLSLILWALTLVVTVKYVLLLLRADNHGEGGTLSLTALASRALGRRTMPVVTLGIIGAAMFYGDSVITPAISVLSAVEGLTIVTPAFEHAVLPLTVGILVVLFAVQSRGTARVAAFFGPVMVVWFVALAGLGLLHIADDPHIFWAANPLYGISFVVEHPLIGLVTLGLVFLAVTGGEALYADLGHFGCKPIRTAWFGLVFPALVINYFGQGAMVLANPGALENPFYRMVPEPFLLPMVILATAATVIASQAVITGAYSITRQAIQLGLIPRLAIRHTSEIHSGQIYIPRVNTALLVGVLLLVGMFKTSSALASAYGIAVTTTMVVDALLAFVVIWKLWGWKPWSAAALIVPFVLIDGTFFIANLLKLFEGAWVPLLFAGVIVLLIMTWRRGSRLLAAKTRHLEIPLETLVQTLTKKPPHIVPGTAVFLTGDPDSAPTALLHNLKHNKVLHQHNVVLTIESADTPRVTEEDRVRITRLSPLFSKVVLRFGFMETPNVPKALAIARKQGWHFDIMSTSFFLSRRLLKPAAQSGMPKWQDNLFIRLAKSASDATDFFQIPTGRVVEVGTQVTV
ncbi:potassium transporter Kup [Rhodoplanes sp. TEM]|uniref:Probable potassium transport system protein Kup n=1 Tax=Rhodoplanes tepidamans TaxID=200616 RepID=A0ABT5JDN2_RHOTP|nr:MULTISPECIES: potassium transporter Kup [Rhodoplanes]MDC7787175.1 potassium transporter Kup [Rhodoplanes tepidamans]MDC7984261.1 potassium transporter Kup [Rhodoplanes sp. TEM]MDQ0356058.1 KUP system potassium uptake protein [Rhodoplanes tepidamans]